VTNFFIDTEFHEDGKTIELISIAIVSQADTHLYLVNSECDLERIKRENPWIVENVLPYLPDEAAAGGFPLCTRLFCSRETIRDTIEDFVRVHDAPYRFWGYFSDYDWVVFCWLWGKMIDLPNDFPKYCLDLKQEMTRLGVRREDLPDNDKEHDALADARWNLAVWKKLHQLDNRL